MSLRKGSLWSFAAVLIVAYPGVALAQLAPQSQEEFEQRYTGWTLQADAPDCNEGDGVEPINFIEPGRFATRGLVEIGDRMEYVNLEGDYKYEETGPNTGTLTITVGDLPIPQVLDLTFNSPTIGTFTVAVFGLVACRGSFDLVETTAVPPPSQTEGQVYYFPHLAVGAGWQTTITYINYSSQEVTCRTEFTSSHGSPLLVSFPEGGVRNNRTDVLPPGGSVHEETDVELSAPLAPGWARANCSGPVKASLLFRRYDSEGVPVAEAGVNAATLPATRFVTFAEQGEGRLGTGVAFANPSDRAALVTFTAKDAAGRPLASVDRNLLPNGHGAENMAPLFALSGFTGSLEITSTEPIVTLSLNFEADPVFSSLPPGELDAAAQGTTTHYFPHLAVGAGWQTTLTYINYSSEEVSCQTDFLSDHGSPLMVSFAGLGAVDSRSDTLPPGGSVHEETNVELSASLVPGWARANCSGPVKASLLFRRFEGGVPKGEAGVNAAALPATRFVTFAEQREGRLGTGVAYANPSDAEALITLTAKDSAGKTLASVERTLLSRGHGAQNMASLFGLSGLTGSLEITSTEPIVTLSLNFEADPVFSSLPPGETVDPPDTHSGGNPDLTVYSFTAFTNPSGTPAGGALTLAAGVRNVGDGASPATTLRYYRSTDATITSGDTSVGTGALGALSPSGLAEESIRLAAPLSGGTYYYGVCVDPVSGESARGNNCSSAVSVLVIADSGPGGFPQGGNFDLESANGDPQGITFVNGRFYVMDSQDDKVYAYTATGQRDAASDFDLDAANGAPGGITFANGRFYVTNIRDSKAYAYRATGQRDVAADFDLESANGAPGGITFANGRLYVVDWRHDKVYAYTASGQRDATADFDLDATNGGPSGITFANGRFYVVDRSNIKVYAYTASGQRDAASDFDLETANGAPDGITFANGRLYVVDWRHDKVYAYTASGQRDATADFDLDAANGGPSGITFANGRFYVVDWRHDKVYAYTASGQRDAAFDFDLDAANHVPTGITFANGRFYVVDWSDRKVYAYTASGQRDAASDFDLDAANNVPMGITFADGRFYVVEYGDPRAGVYAYTASGQRDAASDFDLEATGGPREGITFANGRFYVVYSGDDKVYVYTAPGQRDAGSGFGLESANGDPGGITFANGKFYVVDSPDAKVYAYTTTGQRHAASDFDLAAANGDARGITFANGRFYVANFGGRDSRVYAYTAVGQRDAASDFNLAAANVIPGGIAFANGRFYVVDLWADKVYAYTATGQRDAASDFNLAAANFSPGGIALANGRFYVENSADRKVYAYTVSGQRDATFDFNLDADNYAPGGITFANGRFYVVDWGGDKVYAYTATGQRDAASDFDLDSANGDARGITFGNGRFYVVDQSDDKVYAYTAAGQRDAASDFNLAAANFFPEGITHGNGKLYVVDRVHDKVYAHTATGQRDAASDFDLDLANGDARGIIFTNGRLYVVDQSAEKVYAYTAAGRRDAASDFDLDPDNDVPGGITFANGRFYVVDKLAEKVYAYTASGQRDAASDFDLYLANGGPRGITFANNRFYVVDSSDDKVYSYPLPAN